jgi:hypothetical protein
VPEPQVKMSTGLGSLPCVGVFSGSCLWQKGLVRSATQKRQQQQKQQKDAQDNDDSDKKCGDSP